MFGLFSINHSNSCSALPPSANPKKRRLCIRPWILKRDQNGSYLCLCQELKVSDRIGLKYFERMGEDSFNEILKRVALLIRKEDIQLWPCIPPVERLVLNLIHLTSATDIRTSHYWLGKNCSQNCHFLHDETKIDDILYHTNWKSLPNKS